MQKQKGVSISIGIIIIVAVAAILFGGVFAYQYYIGKSEARNPKVKTNSNIQNSNTETAEWKTYTNTQYGFEFRYPSITSINTQDGKITIEHSVGYRHPNPCDFKGDLPPLERVTDFRVTFQISNEKLEKTKQDNFVWSYENFNIGSFNGFRGESGIEGCGLYTYLFPISENKMLVVKRSYITEFISPIGDKQDYLNIPGIILPNQEENYFNQILSTFKFIP